MGKAEAKEAGVEKEEAKAATKAEAKEAGVEKEEATAIATKEEAKKAHDSGLHPKLAQKLASMSQKLQGNAPLAKKAQAAFEKYKRNPQDALKNASPHIIKQA